VLVGEPTQLKLAVAEKGLLVLEGTVKGKAGHAAREEGINAIYLALNDLEKVKNFQFIKISPFLGPTKVSCTVIHAGDQHNLVPDLCRYVLDIRINELYTHEEVLEELKSMLTADLVPRSMRLRSSNLPEEHLLQQVATSMGLEKFGSPTLSDQALIPYPSAKIGPGDSARSHTADEFIFTQEVKDGITTYISILENYARLYLQTKHTQ
jgi:acetylornithine deacetylase